MMIFHSEIVYQPSLNSERSGVCEIVTCKPFACRARIRGSFPSIAIKCLEIVYILLPSFNMTENCYSDVFKITQPNEIVRKKKRSDSVLL